MTEAGNGNRVRRSGVLIYTILGSLIWNTVLLFVGNKVGENWKEIVEIMSQYSHIILILLIIGLIGFVIYYYSKKKPRKVKK